MGKTSAAKVLAVPDLEAEEVKEPTDAPVEDKEPPKRKSAYPEGTKLFSWTPKDGKAEIIELPMDFIKPNKEWLWEQNQLPFLAQTWNWLDRAGTPKSVQRQCVQLPDNEYMDMFKAWFKAMGGGATPGE